MLELYEKVRKFIPEVEWAIYEPLVDKIKGKERSHISTQLYDTRNLSLRC